jgi:hypothetical protein
MLEGPLSFYCHSKCYIAFKITIESKFNNDHIKFNGNFKSHMTFWKTKKKKKTLALLKDKYRVF